MQSIGKYKKQLNDEKIDAHLSRAVFVAFAFGGIIALLIINSLFFFMKIERKPNSSPGPSRIYR